MCGIFFNKTVTKHHLDNYNRFYQYDDDDEWLFNDTSMRQISISNLKKCCLKDKYETILQVCI